jgi:hypothetical protein
MWICVWLIFVQIQDCRKWCIDGSVLIYCLPTGGVTDGRSKIRYVYQWSRKCFSRYRMPTRHTSTYPSGDYIWCIACNMHAFYIDFAGMHSCIWMHCTWIVVVDASPAHSTFDGLPSSLQGSATRSIVGHRTLPAVSRDHEGKAAIPGGPVE